MDMKSSRLVLACSRSAQRLVTTSTARQHTDLSSMQPIHASECGPDLILGRTSPVHAAPPLHAFAVVVAHCPPLMVVTFARVHTRESPQLLEGRSSAAPYVTQDAGEYKYET